MAHGGTLGLELVKPQEGGGCHGVNEHAFHTEELQSWVQWLTHVISTLGRLKQKDHPGLRPA